MPYHSKSVHATLDLTNPDSTRKWPPRAAFDAYLEKATREAALPYLPCPTLAPSLVRVVVVNSNGAFCLLVSDSLTPSNSLGLLGIMCAYFLALYYLHDPRLPGHHA